MKSFALVCVFAAIAHAIPRATTDAVAHVSAARHSWPATFEGDALEPLELSAAEMAFARDFPGALARFRAGRREIVLRHVTEATRRLHPAADCLRATGHDVGAAHPWRDPNGVLWSESVATRAGRAWRVRERIASTVDGAAFTDASSWWWAAILERSRGPWLAWTVLEPMER